MAFEKVSVGRGKRPKDMYVGEVVQRRDVTHSYKNNLRYEMYRLIREKGMEFSLDQENGKFDIRRDK